MPPNKREQLFNRTIFYLNTKKDIKLQCNTGRFAFWTPVWTASVCALTNIKSPIVEDCRPRYGL
jgi:hypothetical protein